jgi:hypothetical protein
MLTSYNLVMDIQTRPAYPVMNTKLVLNGGL